MVLGVSEVVHHGDGSQVADCFKNRSVDIELDGTKFQLGNSKHIGFERLLERRDQFFGVYCQSCEGGGLFHFLGRTKFELDACRGGNIVVPSHFVDGNRTLAGLVLEFGEFLRVVCGEGLDRSRERRERTGNEINDYAGAHNSR